MMALPSGLRSSTVWRPSCASKRSVLLGIQASGRDGGRWSSRAGPGSGRSD